MASRKNPTPTPTPTAIAPEPGRASAHSTRGSSSRASTRSPRLAAARATAPAAARRTRQRLDLVLFGATGYTGRQAVRALLEQRPDAHWGVAARDGQRLQALVDELVPAAARAPRLIVADAYDAASLSAMAAQTRVLINLAGPYHASGDAVVAACIGAGTHYLDLSGETFWLQRLVRQQHDAASDAGVKIIPCAGYEALPFDLATLWAAHQLRDHAGEACAGVTIAMRLTGAPLRHPRDALSGGTAATVTELLAHDHSGCIGDMACLLPPGARGAKAVAERNALGWLPRYDARLRAVLGPALPGPFINPPVVLRGVALLDDATLFSPRFRYREGTDMRSVLPGAQLLPQRASLALQWAGAAALAAPLAQLRATLAGPLQFQRGLLGAWLRRVSPRPGSGPRAAALEAIGYELEVLARGVRGARFRGLVSADGHPGYRSTPRMVVCAGLGLADGSLGRTPHCGIVPPAAALGIEAVAALGAAGVGFKPAA
jgi:short subunit dehydrogenase-like uncharacterized protein